MSLPGGGVAKEIWNCFFAARTAPSTRSPCTEPNFLRVRCVGRRRNPVRRPQAALEQIIDTAVKHQLRRPSLARLLDLEEIRLPMGEDFQRAGREAMQIFQRCLTATGMVTRAELAVTSHDLFAIIKGLVDSAGQRGELDQPALAARVRRAVFGYLTYTRCMPHSPHSKVRKA
jgi:hypothetical protein